MMKKIAKQMTAAMMAGLMAMSMNVGVVQAEETGPKITYECGAWTPIDEYEYALDAGAPEVGYVLDAQFINGSSEDYYLCPQFFCSVTSDNYSGEELTTLLLSAGYIGSPDAAMGAYDILTQQPIYMEAGTAKHVRYYIDGSVETSVLLSDPEYYMDEEGAWNNCFGFSYGAGVHLGEVDMKVYYETVAEFEAMVAAKQAENTQAASQNAAQAETQNTQTEAQNAQTEAQNNAAAGNEKTAGEELLENFARRLAGNVIQDVGGEIEEFTDGLIDSDMVGMVGNYMLDSYMQQ